MTSYRLNLGLLWLLIQILFLIPAYSQAPEEVIASRTARSKVFFDRENDTYFTRLYTKPVHYRDTSGCFREIDSRVVASSHPDYAYEVARGPFKAYFKEDPLATESIRIEAASGQAISFRLAGAGYFDVSTRQRHLFTNLQTPAVAVSENALTYQNLLPGWLMRFSYHSNRLKEEIVLNQSARSLLPDPAGFNFNSDSTLVGFITELTFNDSLKAFIDDSIEVSLNDFSRRKPVCFRALNRQARFVLPRDFAYLKAGGPDSLEAGYRLNNLKRRIMRLNGKIFVISAVPYAWLQSLPEGEVVIDPTLQVLEAAEDTWIENSNNYGSDSRLIVGRVLGSSAIKRSVLKFPIDELPPYANITRADLNIYYHGIGGLSVNFINRNVRVSAVYTAWDEATATAETPWDTTLGSFGSGPSSGADFESEYADEVLYTADRPLWKVFNIPCIVHDWLSGEYANNGVVLWADNEDVAATDLRMRSSEYDSLHPYLEVQYTLPSISKKLYIKDHLGSTRVVLDESGTVKESYDYYPFGLEMPGRVYVQGTADTRNKFTGKERDTETRWDYFGARYYDPAIGRLLSVDRFTDKYPSMTPYHYAANNPIYFIDVNGDSIFVPQEIEETGWWQEFKNSEHGKVFYEAFGAGGKWGHINVTFNFQKNIFGQYVMSRKGVMLANSQATPGQTSLLENGKIVDIKSLDPDGEYTPTLGATYSFEVDINKFTNNFSEVQEEGYSTIIHETDHVIYMTSHILKNKPFLKSYGQHINNSTLMEDRAGTQYHLLPGAIKEDWKKKIQKRWGLK